MELKLSQKQTQKLVFNQRMQASINILQMPIAQLRELIESEIEENPLLEEDFKPSQDYYYIRRSSEDNDTDKSLLITKPLTLYEDLMRQLNITAKSPEDIEIGEVIIGNIDDDGYLKIGIEEIAASMNKDVAKVQETLNTVQGFEPIGLAGRDLRECLLIQLRAKGKASTLTYRIVENMLEECGKKQYARIAKNLNISVDKVKQCLSEIVKLDPKPGRKYNSGEKSQYLIPDLHIVKAEDEYQVVNNKFCLPSLKINSGYNSILNDKDSDKKTREFIKGKIRSATFLIKCILERQKTTQRIAEYIVKKQAEFLEKGKTHLKPLTLKAVANATGLHESTISRAVENKYVETPAGIYELRDFFSGQIKNNSSDPSQPEENTGHSATGVKMELKNIIDGEDRSKPLSDQKLQKILGEKGINISRRTIAKYREELKILSSHLRKK